MPEDPLTMELASLQLYPASVLEPLAGMGITTALDLVGAARCEGGLQGLAELLHQSVPEVEALLMRLSSADRTWEEGRFLPVDFPQGLCAPEDGPDA